MGVWPGRGRSCIAAASTVALAQWVASDRAEPLLQTHAHRDVVAAALTAAHHRDATLAVVVDAAGSTYVRAGACALFAGGLQVGWLSGGCVEPGIARRAAQCAERGGIGWMDIDTRDDDDLLSGAALGCRGRLHLALLPLRALDGVDEALTAWLEGDGALAISVEVDGTVVMATPQRSWRWTLPTAVEAGARAAGDPRDQGVRVGHGRGGGPARSAVAGGGRIGAPGSGTDAVIDGSSRGAGVWHVTWPPPPRILLLGAGPEAPVLLPLLRATGWRTVLAEDRARWQPCAALADVHLGLPPAAAVTAAPPVLAALVMHHAFERDREALAALAPTSVAFVGLLGPVRRREDLFRVLPAGVRTALDGRLRSPVGLPLGGQGGEAIALSIAAQLQAWRHGEIKG